ARSWNERISAPIVAPWMSFGWSPSPRPLFGSLLLTEISFTNGFGSHLSVTVMLALIVTSLWPGGQSTEGVNGTVRFGGLVSTMCTVWMAVPTFVESSVALHVTLVSPRENSCGALFVISGDRSQTSLAVACPMSTAVPPPGLPFAGLHSAVTSFGAVTSGAVV